MMTSILIFAIGVLYWTFAEYTLHRFLFHGEDYWLPDNHKIMAIHWCIHGIHHTFPQEKLRLVFPIAPGIIIMNLFITLPFFSSFSYETAALLTGGTFLGYVAYDMLHYMFHHSSPKGYLKELKMYHMAHHYRDGQVAFGVSNKFWDAVFNTLS